MAFTGEIHRNEMLCEMKKRFQGHMEKELYEDDVFFYRFLQARNFNVENAETMLRKHLKWRKKYAVANALKYEQPEVLQKYLPFARLGYDKERSVVRYSPAGTIDWIGLDLSVKFEDFAKRVIFDIEEDIEEHKKQSEKLGKIVDKSVYIFNQDKLTFAQATNKRVILKLHFLCDLYQNNYPERLKAIYIINASVYFYLLFSVMKTLVSNSILDKIKIYSDDSYKEDFLELMDADDLPGFLGGNKTDPNGDILCPSLIGQGGTVPEAYYIHKSKRSLATLPDVVAITITRAAFHEVYREVTVLGSYLEWEFEVRSRDVGFGVFYQTTVGGEENMVAVVPLQIIETDDCAEHGMYQCNKEGIYVIVFDNTYSIMRAKEIYYRIRVVMPEEQKNDFDKHL